MIEAPFTLRCERLQPGVPNPNNRVYPQEVLALMATQVQKKISIGVFCGRLGVSEGVKVKIRDASHQVTAAKIDEDGHLSVDCKILNTPRGVELETLIESMGVKAFTDAYEVVPCGVASVSRKADGSDEIGSDYRLASLDIEPRETEVSKS